MEDSFFSAELRKQFELADAEYDCSDEMEVDIAASGGMPLRRSQRRSASESTGDEDEMEANLSVREEDEAEEKLIDDFVAKGCGCSLGPGRSTCSKSFSHEDISSTRMNCKEMSTTELDMLVLANLDAHRRCGEIHGASKDAG